MHNYVYCIILHATDIMLFSFLIITKTHVKFQPNSMGRNVQKVSIKPIEPSNIIDGFSTVYDVPMVEKC